MKYMLRQICNTQRGLPAWGPHTARVRAHACERVWRARARRCVRVRHAGARCGEWRAGLASDLDGHGKLRRRVLDEWREHADRNEDAELRARHRARPRGEGVASCLHAASQQVALCCNAWYHVAASCAACAAACRWRRMAACVHAACRRRSKRVGMGLDMKPGALGRVRLLGEDEARGACDR